MVPEHLPAVDFDYPAAGPPKLTWDADFDTAFGLLHVYYQDHAQVMERKLGSPVEGVLRIDKLPFTPMYS